MLSSPLIFKVDDTSESYVARNHLDKKRDVDRQPAGLNFYRTRWNVKKSSVVHIDHGPYSFTIEHALSAVGTEDVEAPNRGIYIFRINALISQTRPIPHEEARIKFMGILQNLLDRGWRTYIDYNEPRLEKEQAFRYVKEEDEFYNIPADYTPTLEEWMSLKYADWQLHAGDWFLTITFNRDAKRMIPDESGAYLLSFKLYGKEEHAKSQFSSEEMDNWRELWVDTIKRLKIQRYTKERELLKKGYTIDTDYVDPIVHPADPVEP
ncbi:MAG: hypothetical protein GXP08_17880 [Gammaproteobacteria bacterium]|nr:hypothetical protein [Gammaproteobacteria bacterium]